MTNITECDKHGLIGCEYCHPTVPTTTATVHLPRTEGVHREGVRYWSPEEDAFARDLEFSDEELAEAFGRTPAAVHMYRYTHGYVAKAHERVLRDAERSMVRWTPVEVAYVRQRLSEGAGIEVVAQEVKRTVDAVTDKIRRS